MEEEQAESKGEGWFTVHPTTEKLKWKISLTGPVRVRERTWPRQQPSPDHLTTNRLAVARIVSTLLQAKYSVNPTGEETERPSPYANGKFPVIVEFKASYPMTPPKVRQVCPCAAQWRGRARSQDMASTTTHSRCSLAPRLCMASSRAHRVCFVSCVAQAAQVHFDVPVYHPQVSLKGDTIGHMCTDFVSKTWDPSKSVRSVLEKVLAMLAAPDAGACQPDCSQPSLELTDTDTRLGRASIRRRSGARAWRPVEVRLGGVREAGSVIHSQVLHRMTPTGTVVPCIVPICILVADAFVQAVQPRRSAAERGVFVKRFTVA